jgi:hypothetical protein
MIIKDFAQNMRTFSNIALHYKMPLLLEMVEWIIKMNPQIKGLGIKPTHRLKDLGLNKPSD